MNRLLFNLAILAFLITMQFGAYAQSLTIEGYVKDRTTTEAIIGVNIIQQNTSIGTTTDINGYYSLEMDNSVEPILEFTYLGYAKKVINVRGQNKMDVLLTEEAETLSEVVITAFGIKKEKKSINYAIQDVKSDELTDTKQENLVNSLSGKIAGVQVTNSSGSAGASSQILIRGANSVSAEVNNQPLFIVDGLPIDNSASYSGGNRAMDINPEDVASISVLKGPAAAALYGLEAANGAIIITTKQAVAGKTNVDFGLNFSAEMPVRMNPRQESYKQGILGVYDPETTSSWGPLMIPNDIKYDNIGDFLQVGVKQKYDLSISSGNERANVYVSGNYLNHDGIFPGENYARLGALLKGNSKINDKISIEGSANLIRTNNTRSGVGSMYNVYRWPLNNDMSYYERPDKSKVWLIERETGNEWNNPENPYWRSKYNPKTDLINRTITMGAVKWDITDNLNFLYRLGTDITHQNYKSITSPESAGSTQNFKGSIYESDRSYQKTNSTILLSYERPIGFGINLSALLGNNIQMEEAALTSITGKTYRNPDLDNINNMETIEATQSLLRKRLLGVYGDIRLDYKSIFFLGVTGRNDWSSTLPINNNSFFYPSISSGLVLSEFLPSQDIFSYIKLRGNWAQVGKDAPAHRLTAVLEPYQTIGGGFKYDYYAGNPNLKPETTTSWEVGTDLRFFKGKTRLDFTYYSSKSTDQIIQSRISTASGWVILAFNSGSIENKGVELIIEHDVLSSADFNWELSANYSFNNSRLVELPSFVSKYPVTSGQVISAAKPSSVIGYPLMAIEGKVYLENENGDIVIDEDGFPRVGSYLKDDNGAYVLNEDGSRKVDNQNVYLGDREPDFMLGLTNRLKYKDFALSFLFDFRSGGVVLNATNATMIANGTSGYLEEYRNKSIVFNGVVEQKDGSFLENDKEVILNQSYFTSQYASIGSNFVEDASWVRLRYIALQYELPVKKWKIKGVKRLQLSLTGRNLALWTKYSGGDPETNYSGSGVGGTGTMGLDYFNVPAVQGIDLTLKASF